MRDDYREQDKERPPLICSCGNKEFYHYWNAADICDEWSNTVDDLECDADEQFECTKCGANIRWQD